MGIQKICLFAAFFFFFLVKSEATGPFLCWLSLPGIVSRSLELSPGAPTGQAGCLV